MGKLHIIATDTNFKILLPYIKADKEFFFPKAIVYKKLEQGSTVSKTDSLCAHTL